MPTYQYYNKKKKEHFTQNLPVHKRKWPCRDPFVELVITAPNISTISDNGGKEDKARETILQSAKIGLKERDEQEKLGIIKKVPEWSKERREKSKQKNQWI